MTARTFRRFFLASIAAGGFAIACAGGKDIDVGGGDGATTSSAVTFSATVLPYVQGGGGCSANNCHGATGTKSGLLLAGTQAVVYSNLVIHGGTIGGDVNIAIASSSLMLSKNLTGGSDAAHPVHPFATTADANYTHIKTWITAGAPNN